MAASRTLRLTGIFMLLAALVMIPFFIWGENFTEWLDPNKLAESLRMKGALGGGLVIALLVGDLLLPIPATVVMTVAGYVYGGWIGGLLNVTGSLLSGSIAYELCKRFGQKAVGRLVGNNDSHGDEVAFAKHGFWLIALSRWLPVLPEVMACMGGLLKMPARTFYLALLCGTLPMGFAYGFMGQTISAHPLLGAFIGIFPPLLLWLIFRKLHSPHGNHPKDYPRRNST